MGGCGLCLVAGEAEGCEIIRVINKNNMIFGFIQVFGLHSYLFKKSVISEMTEFIV